MPGWVTVFGWVNHLSAEPSTPAYSAWPTLCGRLVWVHSKCWRSKQAHRVIHQPVSVVCSAVLVHGCMPVWLASGDQRWLTGSGSTSEACLRWCAIQIRRYFTSCQPLWLHMFLFLSASLYVSKRSAYWDRLCRDVVGRWLVGWLVVTCMHCGQTVHPRPIVTMEH